MDHKWKSQIRGGAGSYERVVYCEICGVEMDDDTQENECVAVNQCEYIVPVGKGFHHCKELAGHGGWHRDMNGETRFPDDWVHYTVHFDE